MMNDKFMIMLNILENNLKPSNQTIGNIQNGFIPINPNIDQFVGCISKGMTFKPAFMDGTKNSDWINHQMFCLDFDNGTQIEEQLKKCTDYGLIPNIVYESFSSTEELLKFRIIFILDKPITVASVAKEIMLKLIQMFPDSDKVCKDFTRMFFGTNKEVKVLNRVFNISNNFTTILNSIELENETVKESIFKDYGVIYESTELSKVYWTREQWNNAMMKSDLMNAFFNDLGVDRLHFEDLKVLFSNLNVIEHGLQRAKEHLDKSNKNYQPHHYKLLNDIIKDNWKPIHLNKSPMYPQDSISLQSLIKSPIVSQYNYVSEMITIDEVNTWNTEIPIYINAGTGCGKTYWCMNVLNKTLNENEKILIIENRKIALDQINEEIKITDYIKAVSYQYIEENLRNNKNLDFSNYKYIIYDEAHYFTTDCVFNPCSIMSFEFLTTLKHKHFKIFMTATDEGMYEVLKDTYGNFKTYRFGVKYDHIDKTYIFNKTDYIKDKLKDGSIIGKAMIFIDDVDVLSQIYLDNKEDSMFLCSSNQSKYTKYIKKIMRDDLINNNKFDCKYLFGTSVISTGFNIKDEEVTDIFCVSKHLFNIIQWIGRYRSDRKNGSTHKINIHIKNLTNYQINGICNSYTQLYNDIKLVETDWKTWDAKSKYQKTKEVYIYHDNIDNTYKVNKLSKMYIQREYDKTIMFKSENSSWVNNIKDIFGNLIFVDKKKSMEELTDVMNEYKDIKIIGKNNKLEFYTKLNLKKVSKDKHYSLIIKPEQINETISDLGFTIIEGKTTGQTWIKVIEKKSFENENIEQLDN